ncbi:MAG TPA: ABC transporter permease [Bryobacteraceae bacterium]|nr:ABC transporter permease [Bryobacteraceae bacterium]
MRWIHRLLRRGQMEQQLDKELRFHIDQYTQDLIAQGIDPVEARRRARIELGGLEQSKEACRDARGTRWFEDFIQDVRYTLRTLWQNRGFAAVALVTLALGTGATTVMFSVVDGVLLKPFAYRDPGRLLRLWEQTDYSTIQGNTWSFTYPNYLDCKREMRGLDMLAWTFKRGTVTEPEPAQHQTGVEVPADFFPVLGVPVARGRDFVQQDDRKDATPVAIITHEYWQRHFGGNPAAIGARLVFDGTAYVVIGITPPHFRVEGFEQPIFTPIGLDPAPWLQSRGRHGLHVWARLRPGATLTQAQAELAVIGRRLAQQFPDTNKGRTFMAAPLRPEVDQRSTLWLLQGAVGLVLLIACANIASLLLARAVSRERELATRAALGAGRGRLARQCLTESCVLALTGGLLGTGLAAAGIRPFLAWWPGELLRSDEVRLDVRTLLFALGISLASGILFGLAPAMGSGARSLGRALHSGSRSVGSASRKLQGVFVAAEVAIAIVLLVSAGMLGRTVLRLAALDPGLDIRNVLTARTALSPATLADPARTRAAWNEILDGLRSVPGVEAAATIDTVPMRDGTNQIGYRTQAEPMPDNREPYVLANCVSPDYLKVMRIPLRAGRFITEQDRKGSQSVVVIDEAMARQAFPGENPIGRRVWIGIGPDPAIVVGVVGHVRQWGAGDDDSDQVRAQLYYPFAQVPDQLVRRWSDLMSVAVRASVDPLTLVESLRREVRGAMGDQVLYEVNTMQQLAAAALARQRFLLLLFGIFAGLALLLATIGIYGVLAYLTNRRVPEIGVRIALGATSTDVMSMVLRQSLAMVSIGVALGLGGAIAAVRLLERLVEGARPTPPSTFVTMIAILVAAAFCASFLPAGRASRIDPLLALRQD